MYPQSYLKLNRVKPIKKHNVCQSLKRKKVEIYLRFQPHLYQYRFHTFVFFMVATVMRDSTLMIQNSLPAADQIQKLDKKDRVMYIYAGKPSSRYTEKYGTQARIQLNDKFADVGDVAAFVLAERASKRQELQNVLTTALKVDGETNMGLISDIKQELRKRFKN